MNNVGMLNKFTQKSWFDVWRQQKKGERNTEKVGEEEPEIATIQKREERCKMLC